MKLRSITLLLGAFVMTLALAAQSSAQVVGVETIGGTWVPGQPFDAFYPNIFDPLHPKKLTFSGFANNGSTGANNLTVVFDWLDATGKVVTTPPITVPLVPGPDPTPLMVMHEIPFCPQQVSLHFEPTTAPVVIEATFRHECIIPEPSTWMMGTVAAAVGGFSFWRQRRK